MAKVTDVTEVTGCVVEGWREGALAAGVQAAVSGDEPCSGGAPRGDTRCDPSHASMVCSCVLVCEVL